MRPLALSLVPLVVVGVCGCLSQLTGAAAAQEAAQELNVNTRFGRMQLAIEHVDGKVRDKFARSHGAWGGPVRIADSELAGVRLAAKDQAEVFVRVAWYNVDQQELHVTTLRQTYKDHKGDWLLEKEDRVEGDPGLLGDPVVAVAPPTPRTNAQFATVRIGGED